MSDIYQIIASGGVFIACFSLKLLLTGTNKGHSARLMTGWVIALGINQVYFFMARSEWAQQVPASLQLLGYSMPFIHFPLLYLFTRYSLSRSFEFPIFLHLIPWVVFMFLVGGYMIMHPETFYFENGFLIWRTQVPFLLYQHGRAIAVVAAFYTGWSYLTIIYFKKKLIETHSNEATAVFNGLQRWIILAIVFFIVTYTVIEVSLSTSFIPVPDTFGIISVFTTLYISYVGYYGIMQKDSFDRIDFQSLEDSILSEKNSPENTEELKSIVEKLKSMMDEKQLYLDPDLTIADLAKAAGLPIGKVSQALNHAGGINFYDFTNTFRVAMFKSRIHEKSYEHYSLLGLAFECGFSSKSTFNDFFKRTTGMTPSQYRKMSGKKLPDF
ncbi:MAG TPA: helix-turn-helix domain-containing protein [Saprospiraceae bacterium]|nr:helix-turn-helix domain-containing protein [Saprospiraceae bacterium]